LTTWSGQVAEVRSKLKDWHKYTAQNALINHQRNANTGTVSILTLFVFCFVLVCDLCVLSMFVDRGKMGKPWVWKEMAGKSALQ
jgi:hypothetical protein